MHGGLFGRASFGSVLAGPVKAHLAQAELCRNTVLQVWLLRFSDGLGTLRVRQGYPSAAAFGAPNDKNGSDDMAGEQMGAERETFLTRRRLLALGALGAVATLPGCAIFRRIPPVPVAREGFIVREAAVAQPNMTAFLPEGDTVYMSGEVNSDTVAGFEAVRASNPDARRLVILEAGGETGTEASIAFGRAIREAGFATHLRNDSVVSGGAVDAFLGGTRRTIEEGAVVGAARGANADAHKGFVAEMTGGDGYARYAQEFGGRRRPRAMTIAEIGAMGITSRGAPGTVLEVN